MIWLSETEDVDTLKQKLQKADRLNVITQKIGFTLWQLQELEGASAQYFVLLVQAKKGMGIAAGNALDEKAQSKTFGTTVNQIIKAGLLSKELEQRFVNIVSERNWLVHRSRSTSRDAIHSDSATQRFLVRLSSISEDALILLNEIGILTESYVIKQGVSRQYIEAAANELLEQWYIAD